LLRKTTASDIHWFLGGERGLCTPCQGTLLSEDEEDLHNGENRT